MAGENITYNNPLSPEGKPYDKLAVQIARETYLDPFATFPHSYWALFSPISSGYYEMFGELIGNIDFPMLSKKDKRKADLRAVDSLIRATGLSGVVTLFRLSQEDVDASMQESLAENAPQNPPDYIQRNMRSMSAAFSAVKTWDEPTKRTALYKAAVLLAGKDGVEISTDLFYNPEDTGVNITALKKKKEEIAICQQLQKDLLKTL
jgi:hypothetical protein